MKRLILLSIFCLGTFPLIFGQTYYDMSSGNYSQNFSDIANWTNNFAAGIGAANYAAVTSGTYPAPNQVTVFASGTSGGAQKGTLNIQLLATGSTDNSNAAAFDLCLNFTDRVAGTVSLDWACVFNSTGNRASTFKLQTNTGTAGAFVDLASTSVVVTNNVASSGSLTTIALPSGFTGLGAAKIRFYFYNSGPGSSGSRPKISIDNVSVTSTSPASITLLPVTQDFGPFCNSSANAVALTYTISGTITAPFMELSNSSGSFASGTANLGGSVTGGPTYTITADIPASQAASALYRVRVVSTDVPAITSSDNGSNITVIDPVTPSVTINDPGAVCANQSVTFTPVPVDLGGGTATYSWTINGVPDAATGPTYTQNTWVAGNSVQAVMSVSGGCVSSSTASSNTVTPSVSAATPDVSIAITTGTNPICSGNSVEFTATPSGLGGGIVSYQWLLNDGNVGANSPTYDLLPDNNDAVKCVITDEGGCVTTNTATSNTITMTVKTTPATPVASSNSPVCAGGTLELTSDATGTISWTGPNGFISALQNPTIGSVTTAASGTYYVTSTVDGCTSDAGSTTVTVKTAPGITTPPASVAIYEGQSHTFTVVATGSDLTYKWFVNNVEIPSTNAPSYMVSAATLAMSGNSYNCEVSGYCPSPVTSAAAVLTVNRYPIAQWHNDAITLSASAGNSPVITIGSAVADFGVQTTGSSFTGHHASSASLWSTPAGNGSVKAVSSSNWAVGDYYEFIVKTTGYIEISVAFDQTGSNTGPKDFKLQYSTDGTSFTDFGTHSITNDGWNAGTYNPISHHTYDLNTITNLNAKSAVYFRVTDNSTTSVNGGTVASGGTGRIDNFAVYGTACSTPPCNITCAGNMSLCTDIAGGDYYTVPGEDLDPIIDCAGSWTLFNSFNSTATLSGAQLPVGSHIITWTLFDPCYNAYQCVDTLVVGAPVCTIEDAIVCPDKLAYVDVTVKDFLNVGAISMAITYDPSKIAYVGYTSNPALWENFVVNLPGTPSGTLDTIFAAGNAGEIGPGIDLDDDAVLFTLIFSQTSLTAATDLKWTYDEDTYCELWPFTAYYVTPYCDEPKDTFFIDGSLTPVPNPTCLISGEDGPVCPGDQNDYSGPDDLLYSWVISGNGTINGPLNEQTVSVTAGLVCGSIYKLTLTVTDANGCSSQCEKEVTVSAPLLTVSCPAPVNIQACEDQAAIDTEFYSWLGGFTHSGGCGTEFTDLNIYFPPDACTGGRVTINYTASDDCGQIEDCESFFDVQAAPAVVLNCPAPANEGACQTQTTIDGKFDAWLDAVTYSGGCGLVVTNDAVDSPSACGGSTTVIWTAESNCESPLTCSSTFTVATAPDISVSCPAPVNIEACQDQNTIDTEFYSWLSGFSYSGGCGTTATDLNNYNSPDACTGGRVTIDYVASDNCNQSNDCESFFDVQAAPAVVLTAPEPENEVACQTQSAIDGKFAAWLDEVSYSGGCNLDVTNDAGSAPSACGGSAIVTWTAESDCQADVMTSSSFTVAPAPDLSVSCPGNVSIQACEDQATIDTEFNSWLGGFSYSGGCGTIATNLAVYTSPDACTGGKVTIHYSASDNCSQTEECESFFDVQATPPVVLTCPDPDAEAACQSQTEIDGKFAAWLDEVIYSGGCNLDVTNDAGAAPSACGGSVTVTWTATSDCDDVVTCSSSFSVDYPEELVVNAPAPVSLPACTPAPDILAAYTHWYTGFSFNGDCNPGSNIDEIPDLPLDVYCNGADLSFTLEVTGQCSSDTKSSTFFVAAPDPLEVYCPAPVNLPACTTPEDILSEYNDWVDGFSFTGDCNPTSNIGSVPQLPVDPHCNGASLSFTFVVTGDCNSSSCSSTFTVAKDEAPEITCPDDYTAHMNTGCNYVGSIGTAVATDDCTAPDDIAITNDAPAVFPEGNTTVVWSAEDLCGYVTTCEQTVTVVRNTISGTMKYYNTLRTPMGNVTVHLSDGSSTITDAGTGYYEFTGKCAGDYTLTVTNINKPIGYINSSDASGVNYWNTHVSPVEHAKFLAGDVSDDDDVTATDALAIQNYFVFGYSFDRVDDYYDPGYPLLSKWSFWKAGEFVTSHADPNRLSPYPYTIDAGTVNDNVTCNIFGMGIGDFNGSFVPDGAKAASGSLQLGYNDARLAEPEKDYTLSLQIRNSEIVSAISLVMIFPAELAGVTDVTMEDQGGLLAWAVDGNELRIGWNTTNPVWFEANSELLKIHIRTTAAFGEGDAIRLELAADPRNELADGIANVIPDAVISADQLEFSANGIVNPPSGSALTLDSRPNPFTNYTMLTYSLPADGHVTIKISDMLGRVVAVVKDEQQLCGKYTVKLDALPLQTGLYTASLILKNSNGEMVRVIKLIREQ
jgi:hypothetical protein